MNREDIIRIAVEKAIAAERNKLSAWMIQFGFATGHGDTMENLLAELEWQVKESVEAERDACAALVESLEGCSQYFPHVPEAIRARGNT